MRKKHTMKLYLLRDPEAVEPQDSFRPLRENPAMCATFVTMMRQSIAPTNIAAMFFALSVHNDSRNLNLFRGDAVSRKHWRNA